MPTWPRSHAAWSTLVAILGTTISPYLFFWQASQEVEEMSQSKHNRPLRELAEGGSPELDRIKIDTTVGMLFSNAIAFFIILTTAAVLNAHGVTNISSANQAAEALRPVAGPFASRHPPAVFLGSRRPAHACPTALGPAKAGPVWPSTATSPERSVTPPR